MSDPNTPRTPARYLSVAAEIEDNQYVNDLESQHTLNAILRLLSQGVLVAPIRAGMTNLESNLNRDRNWRPSSAPSD
jgi:hypothetical protein